MTRTNNAIEHLHDETIRSYIEPINQKLLKKLEIFNRIDSTNSYLLTQAKNVLSGGSVCFADEQSAGRGRLGRNWFSPAGFNIYCSILWSFEKNTQLEGLSLMIAVSILNALKKYGIDVYFHFKWPNDVLYQGRKLAGILLENRDHNVVIGIGLNIFLPPECDTSWVGLQEIISQNISRNKIAGLLINEIFSDLQIFQKTGLTTFVKTWSDHDYFYNQKVQLILPTQNKFGIAKGINSKGQFLLQNETGKLETINSGEISLRGIT